MNTIPKTIHITCKQKNELNFYELFIDSIISNNKNWKIHLYDDEDIHKFIINYFPYLENIYEAYPTNIQRMDLFRLLILLRFGGVYMDADVFCYKSLDNICQYYIVLAEEKTLSFEECIKLGHSHPLRIANYMLAGVADHPFLKMAICAAIMNVNKVVNDESDVLNTTGPGLITDVFHQYIKHNNDIHLLENKDHWCIKECCKTPSCHFGDYATHVHFGSWRWQHLNVNKSTMLQHDKRVGNTELANAILQVETSHFYI